MQQHAGAPAVQDTVPRCERAYEAVVRRSGTLVGKAAGISRRYG
jgi:hypothetical protein